MKRKFFMHPFRQYLQAFPNFKPDLFDSVLPYLSEQQIGAGEYWLRQGQVCRDIAFVEQGLLRQYYLHEGKEITHCFCKENTLSTSYSSFITHRESDIAIQAIEASTLILLSYESLQALDAQNPFWQQVGRLAAEHEVVITESHRRFLSDLSATERYQQILEADPSLLQRVPLRYLATYLQIAPETLSRIRKKLSRT